MHSSVSFSACHHRLPYNIHFFSVTSLTFVILFQHSLKTIEEQSLLPPPLTNHLILAPTTTTKPTEIMCIQVVERYAACRCVYYKHAIDPCSSYKQRGHMTSTREVSVGYKCSRHTLSKPYTSSHQYSYPDSGYGSSSSRTQSGGFRR